MPKARKTIKRPAVRGSVSAVLDFSSIDADEHYFAPNAASKRSRSISNDNIHQFTAGDDLLEISSKAQGNISEIVCRDLSGGKEIFPVRVVNAVDDADIPSFRYITGSEIPDDVRRLIARCLPETLCCSRETCGVICAPDRCPCRLFEGHTYELQNHKLPYHRMDNYDNSRQIIKECGAHCSCASRVKESSCSNRVLTKGSRTKIDVFRTKEGKGWGARCRTALKQGQFVGEYVGVMKKDTSVKDSPSSYLHGLGEDLLGVPISIDSDRAGNFTRFLNHSCEPNCFVAKIATESVARGLAHLGIFTLRDMDAYVELTIDYGNTFWQPKNEIGIYCLCGSKTCHWSKRRTRSTRCRSSVSYEYD